MKIINSLQRIFILILTVFFVFTQSAFALPQGAVVVSGQASFNKTGPNNLNITASNQAIINYNSFNIGSGESVQFIQPFSTSVALNRVIGGNPSSILGSLSSNGTIFLVNPNGILFGKGSIVNTGSFLASTLDISDSDFLSGNYQFNLKSGYNPSYIINRGLIESRQGGFVVLASPLAVNEGSIIARQGSAIIAGVSRYTVSFDNNGLISFVVPGAYGENGGVLIPASDVDSIIENVVNMDGAVEANAVIEQNGTIKLENIGGTAINSGIINANASGSGVNAGSVNVNSDAGTFLLNGSSITANGEGNNSSGGKISILSSGNTYFLSGASLTANGGIYGGNGGYIELSAGNEAALGGGLFSASAANGNPGTVLIDPATLDISTNQISSGTNLSFTADNSITVDPGVIISTRNIGANTNYTGAASTGNSGDISITAPQITVGSGAELLSFANSGYTGGDITLTATALPSTSAIDGTTSSDAGIAINGAALEGKDITINATADSSNTFTDGDTPVAQTVNLPYNVSFTVNSASSIADATAEITIGSGTNIIASGDLTIESAAATSATVSLKTTAAGIAYGESNPTATIDVASGSVINAGGSATIDSQANSTADIENPSLNLQNLHNAAPLPVTLAYSSADVTASSTVDSGASITTGGNFSVESSTTKSLTTSDSSSAYSDSSGDTMGAGIAIAGSNTSTTAELSGNATIAGDLTVQATDTTTINKINAESPSSVSSTNATSEIIPIPGIAGAQQLTQEIGTFLQDSQSQSQNQSQSDTPDSESGGQSATIGFSAAFAYDEYTTNSQAYIGQNADINVTGNADSNGNDISVLSNVDYPYDSTNLKNAIQAGATADTSMDYGAAGAILITDFTNNSNAYIGEGATVNASAGIDVDSEIYIPYVFPYESIWGGSTPQSISDIKTAITDIKGFVTDIPAGAESDGFLSTYAQSSSSSSKVGVAGSVNYLSMANNNYADIDSGAYINPDSSTVYRTGNQNVTVNANTDVETVNASGVVGPKFTGTGGSDAAVGGSYLQVNYNNTTKAEVKTPASLYSKDLSVSSNTTDKNISIAVSGGRSQKFCLTGTFSLLNTNNTTLADIDNSSSAIQSGAVSVNANDGSQLWNISGGIAKGGNVGIGASISLNNITRDTEAAINDLLNTPSGTLNSAGAVTLNAENSGEIYSFSLAGSYTSASSSSSQGSGSQNENDSSPDEGGQYGIAVSGDASVNTIKDTATAYAENSDINAASLSSTAQNNSDIFAVAGSASISTNSSGSAGIAGSYTQNTITDTADAYIDASKVSVSGNIGLNAYTTGIIATLSAGGSGATGDISAALAGSVSVNSINNDTEGYVNNSYIDSTAGSLTINADSTPEIDAIAGSADFGTNGGIGAGVALNTIGGYTYSYLKDSEVNAGGDISLDSDTNAIINAISASASLTIADDPNFSAAGAISINTISGGETESYISGLYGGKGVTAEDISLSSADSSSIFSIAGNISISIDTDPDSGFISVAAGASVAYNDIGNDVMSYVANSDVTAVNGNVKADSESSDKITTGSAGISAGLIGLAGSAVINNNHNDIESYIDNSTVTAYDDVALLSDAGNTVDVYGGAIAAGAMGIGGSATVNNIKNTIKSYISGSSDVSADGNAVISVPNADGTGSAENIQGLAVIAESSEDVNVYTANISGGSDAIAADASVTLLGDLTDAYIDSSTVNGSNGSANPAQIAEVKAYNGSSVNVHAGAAAVAGIGVGATCDTTLLSNTTQAYINASAVNAAAAVDVASGSSETENDFIISGTMGSGYTVAGSVGVIELNDNDDAYINGSTVNSGGGLSVAANDSATLNPIAGALKAGGAAGASGSVIVAYIGNTTDSYISDSATNAAGLTDVTSSSNDDIKDYGATLSVLSGIDAAGSVIVNTVNATTLAYIDGGAGASVNGSAAYKNSNQDVNINAGNTSTVNDTSGEVNQGFAAAGAAIDVDSINNTTNAYAGSNTDINAGGSLNITANSLQQVDSIVVAFGGAAISVQGAVSLVDIGSAMTTGTYGGSAASGSTGSVVSGQISADSTNAQLGNTTLADNTDSNVSAATGSLSVSGDFNTSVPVSNSTSSYIGSGAVINTGGDITVNSNNTTNVKITSGAGSAGTYGVGGAVGIAAINPLTNAFADSGSSLTAGGNVTIGANGTVNNSSVNSYTGAAGFVGLGAAVSYLNSNNDVSAFIGQNGYVNAAGNLEILSNATTTNISAGAYGAVVGYAAGGVTIADDSETGNDEAYLGQYVNAKAANLTVNALNIDDNIQAVSQAAGGGIASGTGTSATVNVSPIVNAYVDNSAAVNVLSNADVEASLLTGGDSNAEGISQKLLNDLNAAPNPFFKTSAIKVGVSYAETDANPFVSAYIGNSDDITAAGGDISVESIYNYDSSGNAVNDSLSTTSSASSAGALLAGAAEANSVTNSNVTVNAYTGDYSNLHAGNNVNINSEAYNSVDSTAGGETGGVISGGGVDGTVNITTLSNATVGQSATVYAGNYNISIGSDAESYANINVTGGFGQSLSQTLQNLFQGSLSSVQMPSFIAEGGGGAYISMTNNAQSLIKTNAVLTAKNQVNINSNAVASANPTSTMTAGSSIAAAALSYSEADIDSNSLIEIDGGANITGNDVSMISDDAIYADVQAISHSTADIAGAFASAKSVLNVGQNTPSASKVIIGSNAAVTGYNSVTLTANNKQTTSELISYSNAWATTNTVAAIAYSEADGSVNVGSTVEIDSGSTLTTPNISVTSQSDYTLKRDPEVTAKTVVWFTTVTTYVRKHICSWLPWPLNKLCNWVTKEVTTIVEHVTGAVAVNKVGGDGFIQNDQIIMNGDIYTGSSSDQILIVNQDGTIDPSSNVGATISANNVSVNNIVNNSQKTVSFDVPNGTLSGSGTIYFNNIYPLVEIENNSDKNLTVNQVQMIDSNNGQPDFTAEALNDNSNFTITSENSSSSLIIQNNYSDPNLNIYFNDPIENYLADFNISNNGGSILANNSNVLLEANNITLNAVNGDIGSPTQYLNLELFNSGSGSPSELNATAYGSMYMGATVINIMPVPADYLAAYLNDTAYNNYNTDYLPIYNQTISMLEQFLGYTQAQAEAFFPYVNPYTYETLPSDYPPSSSVVASGFNFNNISAFGNINIDVHDGIVEYQDLSTGNTIQNSQGGLYNINSILAGGGIVLNQDPEAVLQLGNTVSGSTVDGTVISGLKDINYLIDSNGSPDASNLFNFASSIALNQITLKNINYSEPDSGNIDITGNISGAGMLEVLNGYSDVNITNNSADALVAENINTTVPASGIVNIKGADIPFGIYGSSINVQEYGYQEGGISLQNNYPGASTILDGNIAATGNINVSAAGVMNVNDNVTSDTGNISLTSAGVMNVNGNIQALDDILLTSTGDMNVNDNVTSDTGNITLNSEGNFVQAAGTNITADTGSIGAASGKDIDLNGTVNGSYITLQAANDINLNGDVSTYNASGNANPYVTIKADSDGNGTGSINWLSGSIDTGGDLSLYAAGNIGSQSSPIQLGGSQSTVIKNAQTTNAGAGIYINATEGLNIGSIIAGSAGNRGNVILHSDDYIGNADSSITNISAYDLIISASNGIGSGAALNTDVSNLDALNTTSNNIGISNNASLTLADLNSDGYAAENNGGGIIISAAGVMNVNGNVQALSNILLTSTGDMNVNDNVTSNTGNISLTSAGVMNVNGNIQALDDILLTSTGDMNVNDNVTSDTGNITLNSEGNFVQAAGTNITADTGSIGAASGKDIDLNGTVNGSYITLQAANDINLNGDVSTYNASGNANPYVTIKADSDGNGTGSINWLSGSIDTGGDLSLYAAGNIGSQSSPIQLGGSQSTVIKNAQTTNAGAGIYINATEGLNIGSIIAGSAGNRGNVILHSDDYIGNADSSITNISAYDLIISASNGIGSGAALNTDVSNLDALNTTSNNIGISNNASLTLADLNSDGYAAENNGGGIIISAAGVMNVNGNVQALSNILLTSTGDMNVNDNVTSNTGNISLTSAGVMNVNGNVQALSNILLTSTGDMNVNDNVTSNTGNISLTSAGVMNVNGNIQALDDILLTSTGDMNVNDNVTSDAGNITLNSDGNFVQAAGSVINSLEEGVNINAAYNDPNSAGGNITQYGNAKILSRDTINLSALNNVTLSYLSSSASGVNIYALRGSIMDNTSGDTSIFANSDSYLWAGYIIGKYNNPLNVNINGGNLFLYGQGQLNLISADIYGIVQPSDRVMAFYATSPGLLLFNNRVMGGKIINEYFRLTSYWRILNAFELLNVYKNSFYGFLNYNITKKKKLPYSWR